MATFYSYGKLITEAHFPPPPFQPGASWSVSVTAIGLGCGTRAAWILNWLPATSMALALGKSSIEAKSQLEE